MSRLIISNFQFSTFNFPLLVITILLLTSCSKNDVDYGLGEYRVDLATVSKQTGSDVYFILDNEKTLFSPDYTVPENLKDNQRVQLNYSIISDKIQKFDYQVKINGLSAISQGDLVQMAGWAIDTLKNDPIQFESVWIGSKYLNMTGYLDYYSIPHRITLVQDTTIKQNNMVFIEFRHDKRNDPPGPRRRLVASFDLSKVLGEPQQNKNLLVKFNTSNYGEKTYNLVY